MVIHNTQTYLNEVYKSWVVVDLKHIFENFGAWLSQLIIVILE